MVGVHCAVAHQNLKVWYPPERCSSVVSCGTTAAEQDTCSKPDSQGERYAEHTRLRCGGLCIRRLRTAHVLFPNHARPQRSKPANLAGTAKKCSERGGVLRADEAVQDAVDTGVLVVHQVQHGYCTSARRDVIGCAPRHPVTALLSMMTR